MEVAEKEASLWRQGQSAVLDPGPRLQFLALKMLAGAVSQRLLAASESWTRQEEAIVL